MLVPLVVLGGLLWLFWPKSTSTSASRAPSSSAPRPRPPAVTGPPMVLTNPGPLIPGRHYMAKVELSTALCLVSNGSIVGYATDHGWTNVSAYRDPSELPPWWPADGRTDDSGFLACTRWVEADWNGPAQQFAFPSQIKQAWILGPEVA